MADRVMRMTSEAINQPVFFSPAITPLQRKCGHCEEEEKSLQRKENNGQGSAAGPDLENYLGSLNGIGQPLPAEERSFYEPRLGYDFSSVRIHTGTTAARSAQSINALAYTSGNNIVFNNGQYAPQTANGKKLLAHELTHVVQQQSNSIQRAIHKGQDHAGSFEFDDTACKFNYTQNWYFSFPSSMAAAARTAYMASAANQVNTVWSNQHQLVAESGGCGCGAGVDVTANLNTFHAPRKGKHGYDVEVTTAATTGLTTQPARNVKLSDTHDVAVNTPGGLTQQRIAHEFGHTLGITDEYHWWTRLWNAMGHNDPDSIMFHGDVVRPRHYQHFADLLNTVAGCTYKPAGLSSRSLVNAQTRFGITGAFNLDNADFILDLSFDKKVGRSDWLGLFTPRLGFKGLINTATGNIAAGPTASLTLNRIAHPLYLDISTGALFDPEDPQRPASLNIPASVTLGFRKGGVSGGINYTGLVDVLGNNGYTQLIGLNLQFDWGRR